MDFGKEIVSKEFRIKNKKLHLTYPETLNINEILNEIDKRHKIDTYSVVNEIGKTGHEHTHFLVKFVNTLETCNSGFFDYKGCHPNIKKVSNNEHWVNCINYHKKQNTALTNIKEPSKSQKGTKSSKKKEIPENCIGKLSCSVPKIKKNEACDLCSKTYWEKHNKETIPMGFKDLNKYDNITDAIDDRCQTNLNQAASIASAWKYKPLPDYGPEPKVLWRPWQKEIKEEILGNPDERSIICIVGPQGGEGKSSLAEHMEKYFKAFVCDYADDTNLPTQINNWLIRGGNMDIVIIDLSRTTTVSNEFYSTIEKIKNGKISIKKYNSNKINFKKPHVVILSNTYPRKEYEVIEKVTEYDEFLKRNVVRTIAKMEPTLSPDRWDIRTLGRVRNEKTGKNECVIVKREYNPLNDDDELPEGYFKPGQSVSSKHEEDEEDEEYDLDDIFTE